MRAFFPTICGQRRSRGSQPRQPNASLSRSCAFRPHPVWATPATLAGRIQLPSTPGRASWPGRLGSRKRKLAPLYEESAHISPPRSTTAWRASASPTRETVIHDKFPNFGLTRPLGRKPQYKGNREFDFAQPFRGQPFQSCDHPKVGTHRPRSRRQGTKSAFGALQSPATKTSQSNQSVKKIRSGRCVCGFLFGNLLAEHRVGHRGGQARRDRFADAHRGPVVREFLPAVQADNISSRAAGERSASSPGSLRKCGAPMGTTKQRAENGLKHCRTPFHTL